MKHLRFFIIAIVAVYSCTPAPKEKKETSVPVGSSDSLARAVLDVPLPKPKHGDWLYEHPEPGQTFDEYVASSPVTATEKLKTIYLQPIGGFSPTDVGLVQNTAEFLRVFFSREVVVLPTISTDIVPHRSKRFPNTPNEQLLTTPILDYLKSNLPADGLMMLAVTPHDLYPDPSFNFVFGEARTQDRVGVSSFYRYASEPALRLSRLTKTAAHEMCHMLSMQHCTYALCLMNGSNSLAESDSRPNKLCSVCGRKLAWNRSVGASS